MNSHEMIRQLREGFELEETYLSWVLLGRDVVYKIKKAQRHKFIDYSTPEKRKFFCEEEVRLNSQLSPGIYFGVVPITTDKNGRYEFEGQSEPLEYAVKMKRIPSDKRLDNLIKSNRISASQMKQIAQYIFDFHNRVRIIEKEVYDYPVKVKDLVIDDMNIICNATIGEGIDKNQVDFLRDALLGFVDSNVELLSDRQRNGKVRECHGDMRTANVYWDEGPIFIDRIEFNEEYRHLDVVWEVAFLALAVESCGRDDLSDALIGRYLELSQDFPPPKLINFHKSHMALVLAKVHILKFKQTRERGLLTSFEENMNLADKYARLL